MDKGKVKGKLKKAIAVKSTITLIIVAIIVAFFLIISSMVVVLLGVAGLIEENPEFDKIKWAGTATEEETIKEKIDRGNPEGYKFYYPMAHGIITSLYGNRYTNIKGTTSSYHYGLDMASSNAAEPIYASRKGKVVAVNPNNCSIPSSPTENIGSGRGVFIIIEHEMPGGEKMYTVYAHLSKTLVKEGQMVGTGVQIGNQGNTGRSTGPHLHFEVADGFNEAIKNVSGTKDPMDFLVKKLNKNDSIDNYFIPNGEG